MSNPNQIFGFHIVTIAALTISMWTTQAQNLLVNLGFEDPLLPNPGVDQGWATFGTAARTGPGPEPLIAHSGDYSLLAQNAPGNNWNPVGVYQIISGAMPGTMYEFECWYLTDTGATISSYVPPVALEIEFLNSGMDSLGTYGGFNYAIPSNDTWYQGMVMGMAPTGSVYIEVLAMFMDNGQTTTEHVYFDDASIPMIPEPSSLALAGVGLGFVFGFSRCRKNLFKSY